MTEKKVKLPVPREEPQLTYVQLQELKDALTRKARRFGLYAAIVIVGGLLVTAGATILFWIQEGRILIWFGPVFLFSGLIGVGLLQVKWKAQTGVEQIDRAIRKHLRGTK